MKSTTLAATAALLTLNVIGSPLQPASGKLLLARQGPGSFYPITGPTGGVQPRLELRELEKTGEMWNLFLLALVEFQAMDQNEISSWYQIAGIHGMPWISWDGVEGSTEGRGESERGYCPHFNLLFGTWHRPYLTLFEQELQSHAKAIASQFPQPSRATYEDAANKLRVPFWDWTKATPADVPVLPTAFTTETVQVTFPNSTTGSIRNPLFEYRFHPLDHSQINGTGCSTIITRDGPVGGDPDVCDNSPMTIRNGKPTSDHPGLDADLRRILPNQRSTLFNILSQWQNFNTFSNDGSCGSGRRVGSLEVLHNPIHTNNWPGHISPVSVSAFDPMFWLHHANVDRQMALYQAIFPETYVEPCAANSPTYTIEDGEILNADSPLTPFHRNAAGDFWTSANSRNWEDMGYTYPELVGNPSNETLVANIRAQYGGSTTSSSAKTKRQDAPTNTYVYLAEVTLPVYGFADGKGSSQPYNVLTFLGDVPTDSKEWVNSENFVGMTSTIGGKKMQNDQATTITLDLTLALEKAGKKSDDAAVEWLLENLHWRVGLGEFEIPREDIKGLEINLISTEVELSGRDDVFDRWVGGFKEHGKVNA